MELEEENGIKILQNQEEKDAFEEVLNEKEQE